MCDMCDCSGGERDVLMVKYVRLPRLGRLLRLPRLLACFSTWQDHLALNSNAMRMFKLAFLIAVFAHLDACMQFLVAEMEGFPEEGWVVQHGIRHASIGVQYSHSLFKALSHMLCIGYGQTPPFTLAEIWVTIVSMVAGASFYIVLFGIMSALMLSLDRSGEMYEERMDNWQEYFKYCRMPKSLRQRITDYLKQRYDTRKMFDEQSLLEGLPPSLRTDVQMFLCEELVSHVPIFKACRVVVIRALVSEMTREVLSPGDYVFFSGEPADNLYFILSGRIQIESDDGSVLTVLSTGSYFGEFALLAYYRGDQTTHRMANARTLTYCDIYALSSQSFKRVADRFPEVVRLLEATAQMRHQANEAKQQRMARREADETA